MPDDYIYYLFGKEFGWTPEQIDNIDNRIIETLMIFINTKNEVDNKEYKKQIKK